MIYKYFLYYLTFTFWAGPLRDGLHGFCGTWLFCNSLEWGALERSTKARGPAKRGSGSVGDASAAFQDARIPLRGYTFLRKALLHPARRTIPRRYALPCTPKPHTPPRPTAGFRFKLQHTQKPTGMRIAEIAAGYSIANVGS